MPKRIVPLTDKKAERAKAQEKPIRLHDGDGLYLHFTPAGGKLWRFKYRFDNNECRLGLGARPEVSLVEARQRREEARRQAGQGVDPAAARKARKTAAAPDGVETFALVAREWHEKFKSSWTPGHANGRALSQKTSAAFLG